jgi:hypothetical protein
MRNGTARAMLHAGMAGTREVHMDKLKSEYTDADADPSR